MRKHLWIGSLFFAAMLASHSRAQDTIALSADTPTLEQSAGKSAKLDFRRLFVDIGFGRMSPGSDLKANYNGIVGYQIIGGLRFHRYALAELGADFGFGAGKTDRVIPITGGGFRRVGDYQAIGYFGGRFVLPIAEESLLISAGGGYARLKYGESVRTQANETVNCFSCTQRSGNGYYGAFQALLLVDEAKRFGIGFTFRRVQGATEGNFLQRTKTNDSWNSAVGTFSIRF